MVRRAALARPGSAVLGRSGRSARPFHRGPRRRRGRPPSRALTVALVGRAAILRLMGRAVEAAGDARRSLALALEIGDPAGEVRALLDLSLGAHYDGDHDEAVRLARQAGQITAGIPGGLARTCSDVLTIVLAGAGDLAEAERAGTAGLARVRDAGDLFEPGALAAQDRGPGPAGGPDRRRRGAPAGRAPPRGAHRQLV